MSSQKRKFTGHKTDNGLVIETEQDVTHIINANKKEYNEDDGKWGDDIFDNRIARIPDTVTDYFKQIRHHERLSCIRPKRIYEIFNET